MKNRGKAMLRNRNVWIVLIGEFGAGLGLWFGIIGNLEFMQRYVPSDFFKSFILFCGLLAGVFVGPLAGRMIDEYSKKKVLMYSGFGRVLSVIFMFFAIHYHSIVLMIVFLIFLQISAAFYFPALQALIPLIVKKEQLLTLNGIHMNVATIARILGTSIGGILVVATSLTNIYGMSMIAYAFLFVMTYFINVDETSVERTENKKEKEKTNFTEIFKIIKNTPIVFNVIILNIVPLLFIGGFNLMVIKISDIQHSASIKGYLYTAEGISFLIGAFIIKYLTKYFRPNHLMYFFTGTTAIAHLSLFFSKYASMSVFSFALFGLSVGCFYPVASTIYQTSIDKSYHGRLFSFRSMFERVAMQIVLLSTGFFLDTIGLKYMVLIFGAISIIIVLDSIRREKHNLVNPYNNETQSFLN
jgi:MFS family permease